MPFCNVPIPPQLEELLMRKAQRELRERLGRKEPANERMGLIKEEDERQLKAYESLPEPLKRQVYLKFLKGYENLLLTNKVKTCCPACINMGKFSEECLKHPTRPDEIEEKPLTKCEDYHPERELLDPYRAQIKRELVITRQFIAELEQKA